MKKDLQKQQTTASTDRLDAALEKLVIKSIRRIFKGGNVTVELVDSPVLLKTVRVEVSIGKRYDSNPDWTSIAGPDAGNPRDAAVRLIRHLEKATGHSPSRWTEEDVL